MIVWRQTETYSGSDKEEKCLALDGILGNLLWSPHNGRKTPKYEMDWTLEAVFSILFEPRLYNEDQMLEESESEMGSVEVCKT
jgi:hypothetical protein